MNLFKRYLFVVLAISYTNTCFPVEHSSALPSTCVVVVQETDAEDDPLDGLGAIDDEMLTNAVAEQRPWTLGDQCRTAASLATELVRLKAKEHPCIAGGLVCVAILATGAVVVRCCSGS